jgi:uncharacterized protein YfiM (DUF2279 family)
MTSASGRAAHPGWTSTLLASASFARAYTLVALGSVFSSYVIERVAGRVTYVTIIASLCVVGAGMLIARRREIVVVRLVPSTLLLLLGWALASVFWSYDTSGSFWSWISMVALAFLAVVIGHVRDTLQTARALGDVLRVLQRCDAGSGGQRVDAAKLPRLRNGTHGVGLADCVTKPEAGHAMRFREGAGDEDTR